MKKILSLVLAAVMMLTTLVMFSACEDENTLVMATNASFPPYEYMDGDKIVGIDAEIAALIAEKLGKELKIVDTEFGSIIGGVQSGKYDIGMAGLTVNEERKQSVNFTTSYATGVQVVIVKEGSSIIDLDSLRAAVDSGKKIGCQQDTTGHIYASDTPEKGGYGESAVIPYKTGNDAVAALVAGKVDAVIIDNEPAKSFVAANEGLTILGTEYITEEYAIAVSKDNQKLLDDINAALEELTKEGKIQEIINKYIPAN